MLPIPLGVLGIPARGKVFADQLRGRARIAASESPTNSRITSSSVKPQAALLTDLRLDSHDEALAVDQHAVTVEDHELEPVDHSDATAER